MIGRFLEFSVHAPDVLTSLRFYETLGFRQLQVGDTWSHPYAVVSDGRAFIGLHAYEFDSPAVTFVLRDLASKLSHLRQRGITFAFAKTGEDQFNEAGFVTPAGQMVALLEARTYSPPEFTDADFTPLGRLQALLVPATTIEAERDCWVNLGLRIAGEHEGPYAHTTLSGEDIAISVHASAQQKEVALHYLCRDLSALAMQLDDAGIDWAPETNLPGDERALRLRAPEGLCLLVQAAH